MKGQDLPASDQFARYVKPTMIEADGSADGADFMLRATRPEETGLSVNWLEAFGRDKAGQLNEVRRLIRLRVRPSGRFAELNVGTVMRVVSEELDTLRIVHGNEVNLPHGDSHTSRARPTYTHPNRTPMALDECQGRMRRSSPRSRPGGAD